MVAVGALARVTSVRSKIVRLTAAAPNNAGHVGFRALGGPKQRDDGLNDSCAIRILERLKQSGDLADEVCERGPSSCCRRLAYPARVAALMLARAFDRFASPAWGSRSTQPCDQAIDHLEVRLRLRPVVEAEHALDGASELGRYRDHTQPHTKSPAAKISRLQTRKL